MRYVNLLEEQVFHGKVRYSIVGEMTRGIEMVVEVDIYIKVPEKVIKDQKKQGRKRMCYFSEKNVKTV